VAKRKEITSVFAYKYNIKMVMSSTQKERGKDDDSSRTIEYNPC